MRNSASSRLSSGGIGAGSTVAGSSAGVQDAPATATPHARQRLRTEGIAGDRRLTAGALVTHEQRQVRGDREALGLGMAGALQYAAAEHLAARAHLGVGTLRARDDQVGPGARVSDDGRPVEPLHAGRFLQLGFPNEEARLGLEAPIVY